MEDKEHMNEDDELNPNSNQESSSDADSDNFGLPDYSESEESSFEEKKEEEDYSVGEPYSSETWGEEEGESKEEENSYSTEDGYEGGSSEEENYSYSGYDDDYGTPESSYEEQEEPQESEYSKQDIIHNTYEEEGYREKKSPVLWIILAIIVLIGLGIGLFWWFNREESPKVVAKKKQPVKVEQPVVSEPEPEPVTTKETTEPDNSSFSSDVSGNLTPGEIINVTSPTGQYFVIIASAVDDDLLRDYAKKLVAEGYGCAVLAPIGNTIFSRLAIAELPSLNEATIKTEELKSEFGDKIWVKKY